MSVTDEIKARIDIVELVGSSVQLKKTGRNYKGLCPFHHEKTPSFVVFPDSQNWRCFGACGEGGDVFTYVMKREGWDFPEALRFLAQKAGVELEPLAPQQAQAREAHDRLRSLLAEAASFFTRRLLEAPDAQFARQYVEGRGLSPETVEAFGVGYAPDSWDAASAYLLNLGYEAQEIVDAGMLVVKDEGGTYDRFRDRLMIPIRDMRGNVVGFGARALSPEAQPKYLNSPQSALFDKSSLLFGLDRARRTIREGEMAVIVEGYMDVMQAHQAGFTNVVAQMGTALTEPQLRRLSRYAKRLILALDPDTAGQMATDRGREVIERVSKAAAEEAAQEGVWGFDTAEREYRASLTAEFDARGMVRYESRLGFDIRVIVLPEGHDPDDLIRQDPQAWADLVTGAMPVVEYVIQKMLAGQNLDDPKVKVGIVNRISPLINDIANPVERSHYRQRLARLLRIEERTLLPEGQAASPRSRPSRTSAPPPTTTSAPVLTITPTARREASCLAALLQHPRLIYRINRILAECMTVGQTDVDQSLELDSLAREVTVNDFAVPEHRMVFEIWREALNQDDLEPVSYLRQALRTLNSEHLLNGLGQLPYAPDRVYEGAIHDFLVLRRRRIEEHMQELYFVMGDVDNGGDTLTATQYMDIVRKLRTARDQIDQAPRRYGLPGQRGQLSNING